MQEQIDDIMDNFDFQKVLKTMRALNWEWGACGREHEPDESELRCTARSLLKSIASEPLHTISTGGFWAHNDGERLSLFFCVASRGDV